MKIVSLATLLTPTLAQVYLGGGTTCKDMQPICFSGSYKFKFDAANTHTSHTTNGDFGCLGSSPGEQWFYVKVGSSGSLNFDMKSYRDHDYAIWGPYSSVDAAKGACGKTGPPADCSYSGTAHEFANVQNVKAGEYYILVVTNFARITQELEVAGGNAAACDAVEQKFQVELEAWKAAGSPTVAMAGSPTAPPTAPPTFLPRCEPSGCERWECEDWCKCFRDPNVVSYFDNHPQLCPSDDDDDTCDCEDRFDQSTPESSSCSQQPNELTGTQCEGLHQLSSAHIQTAEECSRLCCDTSFCQTWNFHPNQGCWFGEEKCKPMAAAGTSQGWVGASSFAAPKPFEVKQSGDYCWHAGATAQDIPACGGLVCSDATHRGIRASSAYFWAPKANVPCSACPQAEWEGC